MAIVSPIDYSSGFANLQSPQAAILEGLKTGDAIQASQLAQIEAKKAALLKEQMTADLQTLAMNPTADAIGKMSIKYPQLSENFKRSFDILEPAQKQAKLDNASQVYAAVQSGKPDIAQDILLKQAAAYRNSGDEKEAKAAETWAAMAKDHPDTFKTTAGLMLSSALGPEKFAATYGALGSEGRAQEQAPGTLRKVNADADTAVSEAKKRGVEAKYAEQGALLDLEKKGWDVKKIKADIDIARESSRIAAMNAAANREGNALKRDELKLKIADAVSARDEKVREKVSKAESGLNAMDNMLNTITRLENNPSLNNVVGSIEGRLPSVLSDSGADAIALIDTIGSQAFLSQVPNVAGMGSLSNAEGEKLQSALQNLSRRQSETQFRANLAEAKRLVNKGRASVSKRYGVPLTSPDTPAAAAAPSARTAAPASPQQNIEVDF